MLRDVLKRVVLGAPSSVARQRPAPQCVIAHRLKGPLRAEWEKTRLRLLHAGYQPVHGRTPRRKMSEGMESRFELHGPESLHLEIVDIGWSTSERSVCLETPIHGPPPLRLLVRRLKLVVEPMGEKAFIELATLRESRGRSGRPTLHRATVQQLAAASGVSAAALLESLGGTAPRPSGCFRNRGGALSVCGLQRR